MIEEATVDAYGESEQLGGFYTMIDNHLAVPFETTLLGLPATVGGVDLTERNESVAIGSRGRLRQAIPILDWYSHLLRLRVRSGSRPAATGLAEADAGPERRALKGTRSSSAVGANGSRIGEGGPWLSGFRRKTCIKLRCSRLVQDGSAGSVAGHGREN